MNGGNPSTDAAAFALDPMLRADTALICALDLSLVLLMNDSRFPWLVLVPRQPGLRELHDLKAADRRVLMEEVARAGAVLTQLFSPDKINTGVLGNIVGQLHVHVVARTVGDAAWPGPVWGCGEALPYGKRALAGIKEKVGGMLA